MSDTSYDLIVVGGGPGGYVAAIRAAQLGLETAVVEREHLGGICLNWGCIPTKALLRSAEAHRIIRHAGDFGLAADNLRVDMAAVVKRSRAVAAQLTRGVTHLLKKNKVTVIDGHGRLTGQGGVAVTKDGKPVAELSAKHIILATGARARSLPGLEPDGQRIWTYKEAMVPETMPKSLLVVGSGAIGIEFASFFHELGAKTTVVEVMDRILPVEDPEISAFARKAFEKQGMTIHTATTVKALKTGADSVTATLEGKDGTPQDITVDRVILAVGIVGNVEDIGLDATKVKVDRSHVVTDEWCRTDEPGVYAIGDLTGPPWLAHKASHEGVLCVERIAGVEGVHPLDTRRIPGCTYCHPQVASVGLTEEKAKEQGHKVRVGRFPFIGNGKAIALGETEGFIKTVFDADTGEMLGAHMIGAEVTELIQGYAVGMTLETTEAELMHTVFPHPTLSEMMHESVLDAYGRALHF
ncbi:dihydrolipoyl dehydrogenase [Roseospira marina]|uniref:Dihydrolipoyl dehydrogenase n=1 Tax=Roseospira marina TaxID=140057 RepID=A0A5M6IFH9_9PROT|nr:dihydrolipoyl dehydrogenase [Roseospira marina]KAA5606485.1 dihydrolipoyl dehydrogenase [Roseospira marina]MBB4314094.1 dihydrolipoamide dehydrogenase [Roseospira marina]MBB5087255.1 dihydrolipoamide dehydrogenase [Roseospira marina]